MAMTRRVVVTAVLVVVVAALAAALAYLRDPPWLATMTTGMGEWREDEQGTRYRWAGSHSSFFVPAGATVVRIPMRVTFDDPGEWPITATITIDDRPAEQVRFEQPSEWRTVSLRLPAAGSRRHRRIDIRLDRTREANRGVMLGELDIP